MDIHVEGAPTVPATTFRERPPAEQAQRRALLRRARSGSLWACHSLLRCAAGRTPTELAAFLGCSRSRGSRRVRAYRAGRLGIPLDHDGQRSLAVPSTLLMPWLTRARGALLTKAPRG